MRDTHAQGGEAGAHLAARAPLRQTTVCRSPEPRRESRDWFEPAIKLAKIEDYTWHRNRHTFASRLVMAGRTFALLHN
ncbi:MAG TPA: hypothetical protein VMV98_06740 [Acidobacteriaceae bacterium]|nr:hypothetical protein [Acidobacteriaceae bacterium]